GTSQTSAELPVDPAAAVVAAASSASSSPQPLLDTPMTDAVTPMSTSSQPSTSSTSSSPLIAVSSSMAPVSAPQPQLFSQPSSQPVTAPTRMPLLTPVPAPALVSQVPTLSQAMRAEAAERQAPAARPTQTNKGRCFMCRAKIPLAKQTINKCRCEYIYCDSHKMTSKHDCDFDYAKMDRDLLAKNNPKLNDKPRGGRSFTRLD
ncbi:zinc finger domain-containing protein, partial [Lunasporangiospora selenospora]